VATIGHQKQWQYLKQSAQNDVLAQAYLFHGPSQVGKKKIALELCDWIGVNYTNLKIIEPKADRETQRPKIAVEEIKELKNHFSLSVAGKDYKIAVIDNAQTMTRDAQSAMLKLLEEPRGKSLIILIAQSPDQLLETIVSRCQLVRFNILSKDVLSSYLEKQNLKEEEKRMALWLSFGKPGRMINYLEQKEVNEFQKKSLYQIKELVRAPLFERFKTAKQLAENRTDISMVLEVWLHYFREILLKKVNKEKLSKDYSFEQLKEIIDGIERTEYVLNNSNANLRLALEFLLLKI